MAATQFSFPAAIAAALPCGCSSIFNAASRPLPAVQGNPLF